MAQIAKEAQDTAPPDPLAPATAKVISSYSQALDTVSSIIIIIIIAAGSYNLTWINFCYRSASQKLSLE